MRLIILSILFFMALQPMSAAGLSGGGLTRSDSLAGGGGAAGATPAEVADINANTSHRLDLNNPHQTPISVTATNTFNADGPVFVIQNGASLTYGMDKASAIQSGYLSSSDWLKLVTDTVTATQTLIDTVTATPTFNNSDSVVWLFTAPASWSAEVNFPAGSGDTITTSPTIQIDGDSPQLSITTDSALNSFTVALDSSGMFTATNTFNADAPLSVVQIGSSLTYAIPKATASQDGYLSQEDFNSFSSQQLASETEMAAIVGSTFSTVQHLQDIFHSAGFSSYKGGIEIKDNGDMTVDVGSGTGFIRITNDRLARLEFFDWPAVTNQSLIASITYVGVEYNSGSPQISFRTVDNWNYNTDFPLGVIAANGVGELDILQSTQAVGDHASFMIQRVYQTMPFERDRRSGGLIISETGSRNIAVSPGALWDRLNRFEIPSINTSGADTFDRYYRDGIGGWIKQAAQTQWDNASYDGGGGSLVALTNNRYKNEWYYVETDGDLVAIYGQAEYSSQAAAEAEAPPASVPDRLQVHGKLIGRLTVQEAGATALDVGSVFTTVFSSTGVTNHNNLAGLQGGTTGEYNHLTNTELLAVQNPVDTVTASTTLNNSADITWSFDAPASWSGTVNFPAPVAGVDTVTATNTFNADAPVFVSQVGASLTYGMSKASAVQDGYLSSADWAKLVTDTVTATQTLIDTVTATNTFNADAPLFVLQSGASLTYGMPQASPVQNGYLAASDWAKLVTDTVTATQTLIDTVTASPSFNNSDSIIWSFTAPASWSAETTFTDTDTDTVTASPSFNNSDSVTWSFNAPASWSAEVNFPAADGDTVTTSTTVNLPGGTDGPGSVFLDGGTNVTIAKSGSGASVTFTINSSAGGSSGFTIPFDDFYVIPLGGGSVATPAKIITFQNDRKGYDFETGVESRVWVKRAFVPYTYNSETIRFRILGQTIGGAVNTVKFELGITVTKIGDSYTGIATETTLTHEYTVTASSTNLVSIDTADLDLGAGFLEAGAIIEAELKRVAPLGTDATATFRLISILGESQ